VTDQLAQIILHQGGGLAPRLDTLEAFFPSRQAPFDLKAAATSPRYDVALCKFEQGDAARPVFPMSNEDPTSIIGEPVVLLGYPTALTGCFRGLKKRRDARSANTRAERDSGGQWPRRERFD
jgi:hypothetical protein